MRQIYREFIKHNQEELVELANHDLVRDVVGIKEPHEIVEVFLNGWKYRVGKYFTYHFFGYDKSAKYLVPLTGKKIVFPQFSNLRFATTSYFSGAGDGWVDGPTDANHATAHDAANGAAADYTSASTVVASTKSGANYTMSRSFFPTDTSAIADGDTIESASLNLTVESLQGNADTTSVGIVQTSQASNTALVTQDFDQCGTVSSPTEGATRIAYTSLTDETNTVFALNATGLTWVSKTGYTLLGVRNSKDMDNSAPTGVNQVNFHSSEATGTAKDPYLSVTTPDDAASYAYLM